MNIEPMNLSRFWLYKYGKNPVKITCGGMIFSAQVRQCVADKIPVAHPGQNSILAIMKQCLDSLTLKRCCWRGFASPAVLLTTGRWEKGPSPFCAQVCVHVVCTSVSVCAFPCARVCECARGGCALPHCWLCALTAAAPGNINDTAGKTKALQQHPSF